MSKSHKIKRILEIIPAATSWGIILLMILLAIFKPVACAITIIVFDFFWIIRTSYLTTLLVIAHRRLFRERNLDWLAKAQALLPQKDWSKIYHLIIFPVYKEGPEILMPSLEAIKLSHYPKEKIIMVVSFEERNPKARETAKILEDKFGKTFFGYLSCFHPDAIPGEARTKGANATWAARRSKEFIEARGINYADVIVSCFDADTCVGRQYFGCLSYQFLSQDKPHQASYQPMPVYTNNVWQAPSFARLVEVSSSFSQLIESMRLEKFVTFSSHSMSFKTLVDIDYWPVDMISDDSVIYWKAYLYYKGKYRVLPLYITVSMDIAHAKGLWKTITVQYKQKRRWAWGVENFPFVVLGFLKDKEIPLVTKFRRSFQLLENHVSWAVWAILLFLVGPLPLLVGGARFTEMAISYNLPKITGMLLNFTLVTSITWIFLSWTILPPRPKGIRWTKNIKFVLEWVFVPFVILILGSTPALDAQMRLALGKYMQFNPTEKTRKVI